MTLALTASLAAIQGGRKAQEDTGLLWPGNGVWLGASDAASLPAGHQLAVLGDGMGGHVGGAMASQIATTVFAQSFARGFDAAGPMMDRFVQALDTANGALLAKTEQQPMYAGMGTTLIGVMVTPYELGSGLSWISVGDSLLYLWRRGDLARLNEDHSLAPELDKLAEAGKLTWDEAQADPRRHYLRSALTGADIEMIDVTPRPLPLAGGDIIIVASDGIHSLDEAEIARIVEDTRSAGADAVARGLTSAVAALRLPNQDNTTVIALCIGSDL